MISAGYKSAYQQGYSDAMRDFRKEPKTGHWIEGKYRNDDIRYNDSSYKCDKCGRIIDFKENYCPNCGAKMIEPQETETWNGYHGQITAPKGTFERIFNDADDDNDI